MNPGGAVISLTYLASEKVIPGYGGGMSSAKAALESDTRTLAFEAGRKYNIRVNTISAGMCSNCSSEMSYPTIVQFCVCVLYVLLMESCIVYIVLITFARL